MRVDVPPLLGPHVPEEVRRDRPLLGDDVLAVGLAQAHPDVGVKRDVEGLHLFPEPVQLLRVGVGGHVVLRPPHGAHVGEAELLRAGVAELDVAGVVLAERRGDGMPAGPERGELLRVAARRHPARDLFEVERLAAGRRPLAPTVGRLHAGCDAGELLALLRVGGGGEREGELQERELAGDVGVEGDAVEARRLLGEAGGQLHPALARLGGDELGVPGDEVRGDPVRAFGGDRGREELLFGLLDEGLCVGGGRGLGDRGHRDEREGKGEEGKETCFLHDSVTPTEDHPTGPASCWRRGNAPST